MVFDPAKDLSFRRPHQAGCAGRVRDIASSCRRASDILADMMCDIRSIAMECNE